MVRPGLRAATSHAVGSCRLASSREFRIQNSEFRIGCCSRSSGTDSSPFDRGNLPELKLGAQDSLSRPLSPCVTGFSP